MKPLSEKPEAVDGLRFGLLSIVLIELNYNFDGLNEYLLNIFRSPLDFDSALVNCIPGCNESADLGNSETDERADVDMIWSSCAISVLQLII